MKLVPQVIVALALSAVACGGAAVPNEQLTQSQAAIRGAETAGAQNSPQATLHLKRAKEQVATAKSMIADDDNERAEWVLRRAEADAELALALARETSARAEADKVKAEIQELRQKAGLPPQS
jgi:hypothetical protein